MKNTYLICLLFSSLTFNSVKAQKNFVVSGGDATGTGGEANYSIGQIDYVAKDDTGGHITEGVQQPYEIYIITNIDENSSSFSVSIYPNPAIESVSIKVENQDISELKYSFLNVSGSLIFEERITNSQTNIQFKELSAGVYFLKVSGENDKTKTFKIIKNK